MTLQTRHSPYYTNRATESALVYDFPADEPLIAGLHDMRTWYMTHGACFDIPVMRVMNASHLVAAHMFNDPDLDPIDYDMIADHQLGNEPRLTVLALIVLATMLQRTEGARARSCLSLLLENRSDDFMEGVSLYERFVKHSELYFSEEDFQVDVMAQISDLTKQNERLKHELTQTQKIMKEQTQAQQQTVIQVAGNYIANQQIDIHDNNNCNIYATGLPTEQTQRLQDTEHAGHTQNEDIDRLIPIPREGKYTEVRKYIIERKQLDPEFKNYCDNHSRVDLCKRLSNEFDWVVDDHHLGVNMNRNK